MDQRKPPKANLSGDSSGYNDGSSGGIHGSDEIKPEPKGPKPKTAAERTKEWRATHKEQYNAKQKTYMRQRRGRAKG